MMLLATAFSIAFAVIRPVFVSHNDVTGDTQTMTNIQSWASTIATSNYVVNNFYDTEEVDYLVNQRATKSALSNLTAVVSTWEGFLDGSNVVFSITNYVSGSYSMDTAKLRILELRNGEYNEVYSSRDEIRIHLDDFRTNEFCSATNSILSCLDDKVGGKADKAWGKYSSGGQELSDVGISNTIYMTSPSTVFAGGMEYERVVVGSGVVGILTTKGAQAYTSGAAGTFRFMDATSTNYFGWSKTDDYVIGCRTESITNQIVDGNHMISMTYDVVSPTYPIIFYRPTLHNYTQGFWEQLNLGDGTPIAGASHSVEWVAGVEQYRAIINCGTEPSGFFIAKVVVNGDAAFETNMKAKLGGGIVCTDGVHVVKPVYNSQTMTVTWEVVQE